jgi:hypothetical protein
MDTLQVFVEAAMKILAVRGIHTPQAILLKGDNATFVMLDFTNDITKESSRKILRKQVLAQKVDKYYIMGEANVRDPITRVIKSEALIVSEFDMVKKVSRTIEIRFTRDRKEIIFGKPREVQNSDSTWNFFIEEGAAQEKIDKTIAELKKRSE